MSVIVGNGIFNPNTLEMSYEVQLPIVNVNPKPEPPTPPIPPIPPVPPAPPMPPIPPIPPMPPKVILKIGGIVDDKWKLPMVVELYEFWLVKSDLYIYAGINRGEDQTPNKAWINLGSITMGESLISKDSDGNLQPLVGDKSGFMPAEYKTAVDALCQLDFSILSHLGLTEDGQLIPIATEESNGFMSAETVRLIRLLSEIDFSILQRITIDDNQLQPVATEESNGFMSSEDKRNLNKLINQDPSEYEPLVEVTWLELKSLRDNQELIPGKYYKLTDYDFTSKEEQFSSAHIGLQLILLATSESTLSENAVPVSNNTDLHCNDWKIKYCLDNDSNRFNWANDAILNIGVDSDKPQSTVELNQLPNPINSVCFGDGKFVAVGKGFVAISTNLEDWTVYNPVSRNLVINDVVYFQGKFVACCYSSKPIIYSVDGINWVDAEIPYEDSDNTTIQNYKYIVTRFDKIYAIPDSSDDWLISFNGTQFIDERKNYLLNIITAKNVNDNIVVLGSDLSTGMYALYVNDSKVELPDMDEAYLGDAYIDIEYAYDKYLLVTSNGKLYATTELRYWEIHEPEPELELIDPYNGEDNYSEENPDEPSEPVEPEPPTKLFDDPIEIPTNVSSIKFGDGMCLMTTSDHSTEVIWLKSDFTTEMIPVDLMGVYKDIVYQNSIFTLVGQRRLDSIQMAFIPSGRGVIYELTDQFNNTICFDFKSMLKDGAFMFDLDGVDYTTTGNVNNVTLKPKFDYFGGKMLLQFNKFTVESPMDRYENLTLINFYDNEISCVVKGLIISPNGSVHDCKFKNLLNVTINNNVYNCIFEEDLNDATINGKDLSNLTINVIAGLTGNTENPIVLNVQETKSILSWVDDDTAAMQYRYCLPKEGGDSSYYTYGDTSYWEDIPNSGDEYSSFSEINGINENNVDDKFIGTI